MKKIYIMLLGSLLATATQAATESSYTVTVPADADFVLATKKSHYTRFTEVEPTQTTIDEGAKTLTYTLTDGTKYNYRTWRAGGLTQGGYFTMKADESARPALAFTADDYAAFDPHKVNHDPNSNNGYETGDIFVNINERGHLQMQVGDKYDAFAMRTWQLTDNSMNNYFIEPDFHYTVINPDGTPSTGVIELERTDTNTDPWTTITAVGPGTAIVLVTYDAIGLNYYNTGKTEKTPYMGGEFWGAIWPENTAVFVVTVGDKETTMKPNMTINESYNEGALKLAGDNIDAEHDVIYFLDNKDYAIYSFCPTGVVQVEIAYPTIGDQMATYSGFNTEGVYHSHDGYYTLKLKHGRQIVKLTDAEGNSVYQVLTAKKCHREISNLTRPEATDFLPGEQVKIQYSGLFHPANKLAGIYNMSAYITFNYVPNGTSLILGKGQYTFGSAESAQAITVTIPEEYTQYLSLDGVIQVNGFGSPIGAHREIKREVGTNPNFSAKAHKTYFGRLPNVMINITKPEPEPFVPTVADFECNDEIILNENGLFLPEDEESEVAFWNSGSYTFSTYCDDWGTKYYYDFVVTNSTASNFDSSADQYNSAIGHAHSGSNYAVWYNNWYGNTPILLPEVGSISGFYVTNTAWVEQAILKGDGMSEEADGSKGKPFGNGDTLTLTINGFDENLEPLSSIDYILAAASHDTLNYVKEWRWVDLSALGDKVLAVGIEVNSTKRNSMGMTTPSYVCIDDFGGVAPEVDAPMTQVVLSATHIESISNATPRAVERIDLLGRPARQNRGLMLIRTSDGSMHKTVVK